MTDDNSRLRAKFDEAAQLYDQARPGYPEALFSDIVALSGIPSGGRILEVGCGTGQATVPFAQRGYSILAVELGANLAAVARHKLAAYPQAQVLVGSFEDWPVEQGGFDLLISATAYHWVDPAVRYTKAAQSLKPGGAIALFWNQHVWSEASGDFFDETQEYYLRAGDAKAREYQGQQRPEELPTTVKDEIDASGLFGEVTVRYYCWDQAYDAASYIDVLNTYSNHRDLPRAQRDQLFRDITDLIDHRYGGRIVKGYATQLFLAHRRA